MQKKNNGQRDVNMWVTLNKHWLYRLMSWGTFKKDTKTHEMTGVKEPLLFKRKTRYY